MLNPAIKALAVGALAASLMLPGVSAFAEDDMSSAPDPSTATVASSPEQPLAYTDQWATLQPGEWDWYAFKYSFDDSDNSNQAAANLRLDANPANAVTVTLLNGEQVRAWEHDNKLEGFGAATTTMYPTKIRTKLADFCPSHPEDPVCNGASNRSTSVCENMRGPIDPSVDTCHHKVFESRGYAAWSGLIRSSGTYYVLVRANRQAAGPIQYRLRINGDGLSMK
ncbi:MAG: hypothetical protein U0X20_00820 [Caldilineaceae bacterium]